MKKTYVKSCLYTRQAVSHVNRNARIQRKKYDPIGKYISQIRVAGCYNYLSYRHCESELPEYVSNIHTLEESSSIRFCNKLEMCV